jgi:hypothetical protein
MASSGALLIGGSARADIVISGVAPSGPSVYDVFGSGFTGVSRVMFLTDGSSGDTNASFTPDTDSHVIVHSTISPQTVAIFTDAGIGVGFREGDFIDVTTSMSSGGGSRAYHVHESATLLSGFGSSTGFLEQNAGYEDGGGSNILFAKTGSSIDLGGGGSNTVWVESGVTVLSGGGGGNSVTQVPQLTWTSFDVPEPGSLAISLAGAIGLLGWAWRRRKQEIRGRASTASWRSAVCGRKRPKSTHTPPATRTDWHATPLRDFTACRGLVDSQAAHSRPPQPRVASSHLIAPRLTRFPTAC